MRDWTFNIKLYHLKVAGYIVRNFRKDINIVDCGCGWGCVGMILKESGYINFYGFDINEFKYIVCREIGLNVLKASMDEMPFPDNFADCVICMEVLEHLKGELFNKGLAEIHRILKDDGVLIITIPQGEDALKSNKHVRIVSQDEIEAHLPGYKIMEVDETYGRLDSMRNRTDKSLFLVLRKSS